MCVCVCACVCVCVRACMWRAGVFSSNLSEKRVVPSFKPLVLPNAHTSSAPPDSLNMMD